MVIALKLFSWFTTTNIPSTLLVLKKNLAELAFEYAHRVASTKIHCVLTPSTDIRVIAIPTQTSLTNVQKLQQQGIWGYLLAIFDIFILDGDFKNYGDKKRQNYDNHVNNFQSMVKKLFSKKREQKFQHFEIFSFDKRIFYSHENQHLLITPKKIF